MTRNTQRSTVRLAIICFSLLLMAGCSQISVNYDYDPDVTWGQFHTFNWLEPDQTDTGKAIGAGMFDMRIREALLGEMNERNIPLDEDPDLLVEYHLVTQEKTQVTDAGYSGYYYGGYGYYPGRQVYTHQYTEGTLVVDIIDARKQALVWRGSGTGVLNPKQRTQDEYQERVNSAINKILANFPPQ